MTRYPNPESPVQLIAEVGQAHDGSLGTAHAFIDVAAGAGMDAIKFQTHIAAAESTPHEPWRVKFSVQDETRYDYWKRMEFPESAWAELRAHAHERELAFLSSAFSVEAVELLKRVGVDAWKIASGEARSLDLLDAMAELEVPVLLSTGMSPWAEIDAAVQAIRRRGLEVTVMQCTSKYPTPPEDVGLNLLAEMRERWECPVGLSDHTGKIWAGIAAVALGAEVIEVHATLSHDAFGPDVPASLDPFDLRMLAEGVWEVAEMQANPVDKDEMAVELGALRALFMKSAVLRGPRAEGHILTEDDLAAKKPGSGIPARAIPELVGRRLTRALPADHLLEPGDVAPSWEDADDG